MYHGWTLARVGKVAEAALVLYYTDKSEQSGLTHWCNTSRPKVLRTRLGHTLVCILTGVRCVAEGDAFTGLQCHIYKYDYGVIQQYLQGVAVHYMRLTL